MSSLSHPEPKPRPPILTSIANASGQHVATLVRAPGALSATLRDAQGRMRAIISQPDNESIWQEALRVIKLRPSAFQPNSEESTCDVPQRP